MDRMIFCHQCKVEEMVDDYYSDEWKCPKCNQPERSKREDLIKCVLCKKDTDNESGYGNCQDCHYKIVKKVNQDAVL